VWVFLTSEVPLYCTPVSIWTVEPKGSMVAAEATHGKEEVLNF